MQRTLFHMYTCAGVSPACECGCDEPVSGGGGGGKPLLSPADQSHLHTLLIGEEAAALIYSNTQRESH